MKNLLLSISFLLAFSNLSFTQANLALYESIEAAVEDINRMLATAPDPIKITYEYNGATTKQDIANNVIYEFNIKHIFSIEYEKILNQFMVKLICANGERCFYCRENLGEGVIHFIEASSETDAKKLVDAFTFLKNSY